MSTFRISHFVASRPIPLTVKYDFLQLTKGFHRVVLLLVAIGICFNCRATEAVEFHVASNGNDSHPGTQTQPFGSLEKARDTVRQWKKTTSVVESVTVLLHGGLYELREPLVLTADDSGTAAAPVVWRNFNREPVLISGGRMIRGFKPVTDPAVRDRLPPEAREHVLQANLSTAGVTDFGDVATLGRRLELVFEGAPMTLARWPNQEFSKIVDVNGGQPIESHKIKGDAIGRFIYDGEQPSRWADEPDGWVSGYWFWDWSEGNQKIKSIDVATKTIELTEPHHNYGYRKGQRYYAFNLLAELDQPGEWYLDRQQSVLYFWPPSNQRDVAVTLSVAPTLLSFKGASWINFRGVQLESTQSTAVLIEKGSDVHLEGCVIRNTGGWAVVVEGGSRHRFLGCDIFQTGEGGLLLNGGDRQTLTPAEHAAENNHIHHFARLARTYRPAIGLHGVGNRASHNLIHDAPHTAILISGNEHLTEYNEIHHVCEETGDVGAYYMGRDWTMRGNVVKYNYFHHLSGPGLHGAMGVYLDDAASGSTVFGNLFYRAGRAVLIGGGRDNIVENNIFVECDPSIHLDARGIGWMRETAEPGGVMDQRLDAVPFQQPPWSTRYPELVNIRNETPAAPRGNKIVKNVSAGGKWLDLEKAATPGAVFEQNLTDKDPRFVDAAKLNFLLMPDSPVRALDFQPIPIEKIGLYDDPLRSGQPTIRTGQ